MSIQAETADIDKGRLFAWCGQVRAIRTAIGDISEDDPRYKVLQSTWPHGEILEQLTASQRGDAWFETFADLPAAPLPNPEWAATSYFDQSDYPYVIVEWNSTDVDDPEQWGPYVRQMMGICVEDAGDNAAGDIFFVQGPTVDIGQLDELQSIEDARQIIAGIEAAIRKAAL